MSTRFLAQVPQGWHVDSQVEAFQFPGGERHLRVPENLTEKTTGAVLYGADPADIIDLGMWADMARQRGERTVAYIPYFPAARADRGIPFGAKVYADIINSFKLDEVVIFDPHSPVITELVHNVRVVDSTRAVRRAVAGRARSAADNGYVGVIAPDKGAVARAEHVAAALHLPVFKATKHRVEATGKLSDFRVEELPAEGRLLVVDDICDGGGTFCGLAEAAGVERERMSLWVSHGIFSGKANQLRNYFSTIYTTDSHPGARREDVGAVVVPVLPYLV
jgi:ribose-phosphate pyrophosphokinase